MKINEILWTKTNTYPEKDEVLKLIKSHYSDAAKNFLDGNKLYRGIDLSVKFLEVDNSSIERKSTTMNSNNYNRLLSDILPSWKKYPKRNKSVICGTSMGIAKGYGSHIYIVLPKNTASIGFCPTADIWDSFKYAYEMLEKDEIVFKALYKSKLIDKMRSNYLDNYPNIDTITRNNIPDVLKFYSGDQLYSFDGKVQQILNRCNLTLEEFLDLKVDNIDLKTYFDEYFDPEKNKFYLSKNLNDIDSKNYDRNEVWTDSKCLLIKWEYASDLISEALAKQD